MIERHRRIGIPDNLPGGVALINHQHRSRCGLDAAVYGDEVPAGLAGRVLFLHHQQPLAGVEGVLMVETMSPLTVR